MMRRRFRLLMMILMPFMPLILNGCTIEIYDLQSVLPTGVTPTALQTATPVERQSNLLSSLFTSTPPIHLAPTSIAQPTVI